MLSERISRLTFQFIAVLFFLYQMQQSIMKYSYSPTTLTKLNVPTMEMVYEPYILVCQTSQYNYSKSKGFGYEWDVHLWAGVIQSNEDRKVTWKGQTENLSFSRLFEELYDYDYSVIDIRHGKLGKHYFSLNLGMCVKLEDLGTELLTGMYANGTLKLLAVDPNTFNEMRIDFDPKASYTVGPTHDGMFEWADVMVEYTVTDNSINDGVGCRIYDRSSNYEKCVIETLQEKMMIMYGCEVPWLNTRSNKACESDLDIKTMESAEIEEIFNFVYKLQVLDILEFMSECPKPCVTMDIKVKSLLTETGTNSSLFVWKSKQVDYYQVIYLTDLFTLVVDLGSATGICLHLCFILFLI